MILERFSDDIIAKACHPLTGIQHVYRTPPSMAAIADFCEEESKRLARIRELSAMKVQHREPRIIGQSRANVFVPPHAPQYEAMVERAKTGDRLEWRYDENRPGIWVTRAWLESAVTAKRAWRQYTGDELRAMYGQPAEQTEP